MSSTAFPRRLLARAGLSLLLALGSVTGLRAGARGEKIELNWLTDLPAARKEATAAKKVILLNFTGSDWCMVCRKFKKDLLDQPAFQTYARTNLVLVEVDFPERRKLPLLRARANEALKQDFAVGIYPTFVLLAADGTELGRQVGYLMGGAPAFIDKLERFRAAGK